MRSFVTIMLALPLLFGCSKPNKRGRPCASGPGLADLDMNGAGLQPGQFVLSFDDGPSEYTPELLDGLTARGVQATFFMIASHIELNGDVAKRIRAAGHLIGNHTYTHPDLKKSTNPIGEIRNADQILTPYVTGDMFLFRAPYGSFDKGLARRVNAAGMSKYTGPINWDIGDSVNEQYAADTSCWAKGMSPEDCGDRYFKEMQDVGKGIILLHDTTKQTTQMALRLIDQAKAVGFSFVAMDEVPEIRAALAANGGKPGTRGGADACNDY